MALIIKLEPYKLPLRYHVLPATAFVLATIRAMRAEVEDAIIWRGHPDAARICVKMEGDLILSSGEPYCRSGVVEWLDVVDDLFEISRKLIRHSVDHDVVGLQIYARSADAILEAMVYAPGAAAQMGLPPVDAIVEIEYYGADSRVESFYDLFKDDYKRYVEFVRGLAEELKPIAIETKRGRAELPPVYFIERIDATQDVYDHRDITRTAPLYRHHLIDSIIEDAAWHLRLRRVDVDSLWSDVYDAVRKTFVWIGDLLLPRSPEAYSSFVLHIIDTVLRRGTTH